VGRLPATAQVLSLRTGSRVTLTRDPSAGDPAGLTVPCSLPEVFADVRPGDAVWFDDGKIGARVLSATPDEMAVEITRAATAGSKLAADKGINLPDSELSLPCLTAEDLENLPFIVKHADLVGYSFVRRGEDVVRLQEELRRLGGESPGIVLKIETRHAFERLPALLLAALGSEPAGVMIARGDLAVECGWERLAEVQEEVLWLCEAAHVPVIWATQVLEGLAKRGQPSRAEITDAAMGERAECVMLNKGPYILQAVRVLDGILKRMQAHQRKKRPMMRLLRVAGKRP
jgi:pyruvate kinase